MKNWKAIVGVLLVFVLGMIAGGLVTLGVMRHHWRAHGPHAMADFIVRKLSWELRLDAAQREQLRAIVTDGEQRMKVVRKQVQPQVEQILESSEAKVRAMLHADQLQKFDRLVAERKAKWKEIPQRSE